MITLPLIVKFFTTCDIQELPSPPLISRDIFLRDFTAYSKHLKEAKSFLASYSKLSRHEKDQLLKDWIISIEEIHKDLGVCFETERKVNGHDFAALSRFDYSKVDILMVFEGKKPIFHPFQGSLQIIYNVTSQTGFDIVEPASSWPKAVSSPLFGSGQGLEYESMFSFEPDMTTQSSRLIMWANNGMDEKDRPTYKSMFKKD